MSLARRNLLQDKTRRVLSIFGVALSVTLILILKGYLTGMNRQITSYLELQPSLDAPLRLLLLAPLGVLLYTALLWLIDRGLLREVAGFARSAVERRQAPAR